MRSEGGREIVKVRGNNRVIRYEFTEYNDFFLLVTRMCAEVMGV